MNFSPPFLLSNHDSAYPPWGEGWLLASGDGHFQASLRNTIFPENAYAVESVISEIDNDGVITQGLSELYNTNGSYSRLQSRFGNDSSFFTSIINNNNYKILVSTISGLTVSARFTHDIIDADFRGINYYGDDLIFVPNVNKWLLISYAIPSVDKLMALDITSSSVTELGLSTDLFYPEGVYPEYPSRVLGGAVGQNGDAVYVSRVYDSAYYMVFTRATVNGSGDISINYGLLSSDNDGVVIGFAGDLSSENGFVALYKSGADIKAVYGQLSETNSLIFGQPIVLASGTVYEKGHVCWQQGSNSAIAVVNYRDGVEDIVTIVRVELTPSTLQIQAIWEDSYSFEALLDEIPSVSYDVSTNRVIVGVVGDGGSVLTQNNKIYVLSVLGVSPVSFFWHNHTLQAESGNGRLNKLQTIKVLPGRAGQPYLPPRAATEPSIIVETKVNYVCERVI